MPRGGHKAAAVTVLLACCLLSVVGALKGDEGKPEIFKVLRIFLKTWQDVRRMSELRAMAEEAPIDFWVDARRPNHFSDVMISSRVEAKVLRFLNDNQLEYKLNIRDVQKLIDKESSYKPDKRRTASKNPELRAFERRLRDSPVDTRMKSAPRGRPFEYVGETKAQYPFGTYESYDSMMRYMRAVEFYYPHIARLVRIGTTHEGRPIEGLKIGYPIANTTKKYFWIDGNIHAREWASSHTALFIINQLLAGYGKDALITHYVNNINFLIFPCLNPDGYEYSRSSGLPQVRLWRKNRSPEKCLPSAWGGWRCCQGVDLNRNFDFHWGETGASSNPCSNLFAGDNAFSEPEAKAVSNFLHSKNIRGRVDGFISLHTYAQFWVHPFSHEKAYYPYDYHQILDVAERAVARLKSVYGTQYQVGTGADLLSPASGGSDDWAKEKLSVKYVYLIELRPDNEFRSGFILNQEELIPTAIETFEAIKVVIEAVLDDNGIHRRPFASTTSSLPSPPTASARLSTHSALQFVRTQPTAVSMDARPNVNVSVSNNLGIQPGLPSSPPSSAGTSERPSSSSTAFNLPRFAQFVSTVRPSSATTPRPSTITLSTKWHPTTSTTSTTTTTPSTTTSTPSTTISVSTTTSAQPTTTTQTTTQPTTTGTSTAWSTRPPTSFAARFPFTLSAAISIVTEGTTLRSTTPAWITPTVPLAPRTQEMSPPPSPSTFAQPIEWTPSTTIPPTTESTTTIPQTTAMQTTEDSTFPPTTPGHTTETLASTPEVEISSTTVESPSSTRRYGPRFLTPPPSPPRAMTPLSFGSRTTSAPALPPLVVVRADANSDAAIVPSTFPPETTTGVSKPCRDRKYSCVFWITADPRSCTEQKRFMALNCAYSCGLCIL